MNSAGSTWQDLLERLASSMNDSELGTFLGVHKVVSDDDLADAIDIDARARDADNSTVDLHRYMTAIPALHERPVVLDTALEATLRAMRRAGIDQVQAVAILVEDYPTLAAPIRTCAMLDQCIMGTSAIAAGVKAAEPLKLPCGIGEPIEDGQPRYELREVIGRGTQAMVYLSVDRRLSAGDSPAWVAIKVMQHRAREDWMELPSLGAEAQAARRVNHPNVVRVLDRGLTADEREFVVYEYVRGTTLQEARARRGAPLTPREAAKLTISIARGLQAAHNAAVLHCDLKPANILLTEDGVPKIADFGLARHLLAEEVAEGPVGSFAFMSPEQFSAGPDANMTTADLYGLGGILYWLLTDLAPNGSDAETVGTRLRQGDQAPPIDVLAVCPRLDPDLAAICGRALHPDRHKRYASAEAMANDLESFLHSRPLVWNRSGVGRRALLAYRRSPRLVLLGSAAIVVAATSVTGAVYFWTNAKVRSMSDSLRIASEQSRRELAEQEAKKERDRMTAVSDTVSTLMMHLRNPKDKYAENWLQGTVIIETLLGPDLLIGRQDAQRVWPDRIQHARAMLDDMKAAGRQDQFEARVWETMLGYWLLRADSWNEAANILGSSRVRWEALLGRDDSFVSAVATLEAAASYAVALNQPVRDTNAVARARATLEDLIQRQQPPADAVARAIEGVRLLEAGPQASSP